MSEKSLYDPTVWVKRDLNIRSQAIWSLCWSVVVVAIATGVLTSQAMGNDGIFHWKTIAIAVVTLGTVVRLVADIVLLVRANRTLQRAQD